MVEDLLEAIRNIRAIIDPVKLLGEEFSEEEARACDDALSDIYGICEDILRDPRFKEVT